MIANWSLRLFVCLFVAGCNSESAPVATVESDSELVGNPAGIVFLTRDGCANTPLLLASLDAALLELENTVEYEVVNQAGLSKTDSRIGYPTPTILYREADIFGMTEPTPPFSAPT